MLDRLPPAGTVTVTFDKNDSDSDEVVTEQQVRWANLGDRVILMPEEPNRVGWRFMGWNTAANGSGTPFLPSTTVNNNKTVYAQWEEIIVAIDQFLLTINQTNGGTVTPSYRVVRVGEAVEIVAIPNTGWGFLRWERVEGGTVAFGNINNASTTVTLTSEQTTIIRAVFEMTYEATLDYSIFDPPIPITIPHNINSIRIVGRGNHEFNTNIVVANRVNPLRIEFQNFVTQAAIGMHGISSTSNIPIDLYFSGVNKIVGGVGINVTAAGQNAGRGSNGISSVGAVNIYTIGHYKTTIEGGNGGTAGNNNNNGNRAGNAGDGGHGITAFNVNMYGVFYVIGGNGGTGGIFGNPGGLGGAGGHGIVANNIDLCGDFNVIGGNGGLGGRGGDRGTGVSNNGRDGGAGGNGGTAIHASSQVIFSQSMLFADIVGGTGGTGGRGGNTDSSTSYGGWGGRGGRGGHGIEGNEVTLNLAVMTLSVRGGAGGIGGGAGRGFRAAGQEGRRGATGGDGGNAVYYTTTIVNYFSLELFKGGAGGTGGDGGPMNGGARTGPQGHSGAAGGAVENKA